MNDLVKQEYDAPLTVAAVKHQIQVIQQVMHEAMVKDTHYGVIPGCGDKPTLLKAGAEKLSLTFRLAPTYDVKKTEFPNGHREYEILCVLTHIPTGQVFGQGVGICSTMESKYRYRNVADFELTGDPIPADSKEKKNEYRRNGFGMKKVEGVWEWVKYKDASRQENPDLADTYNTVLKMAKKRAHVDAVLTATAASDIFAQDLEDLPNTGEAQKPEPSAEQPKAQAAEGASHAVNIDQSVLLLDSAQTKDEVNKLFAAAYNPLYEAKDYEGAKRIKTARDRRLAEIG